MVYENARVFVEMMSGNRGGWLHITYCPNASDVLNLSPANLYRSQRRGPHLHRPMQSAQLLLPIP